MSNRTIRRAAEHAARKAAVKAAKQQQQQMEPATTTQPLAMAAAAASGTAPSAAPKPSWPGPPSPGPPSPGMDFAEDIEPTPRPISEAKLAANRANAQKSTGAITPEGRIRSSLNAVKTGLTGQTVLLPTDDAAAYQAHLDRHFKRFAPASDEEHTLVQMIADAEWRILRIPGLEASICAIGQLKLADLHPEQQDPAIRAALIQGEVQLAYRRDLSNIALQERRLRNQHKSDLEKLQSLQAERLENKNEKSKIHARMMDAIRTMFNSRKFFGRFDPVEAGFEFSVAEIEYCNEVMEAAHRRGDKLPAIADLLQNRRSKQNETKAA